MAKKDGSMSMTKKTKPTPAMEMQSLSSPLGRGGTPRPDVPNMRTALARRDKGEEALFDKGDTIKGPLGR